MRENARTYLYLANVCMRPRGIADNEHVPGPKGLSALLPCFLFHASILAPRVILMFELTVSSGTSLSS